MVHNARRPHEIRSGYAFGKPRIGKIPMHADNVDIRTGRRPHGALSLGEQRGSGIKQHNGAPTPPSKLTSKEHAHATSPAPDIEHGRPPRKALDQPPSNRRERTGIKGIGHAQLSEPIGPVDVVVGVYGHHPIEHQHSRREGGETHRQPRLKHTQ
ncbi:hypothetical protein SAMN05421837_110326 [Amycolatopsis pretoriensis]|uniref:Uncharacterized protein n=1 Tax=Amycolatopsis pretoriensis TaxID=218821 RepID=A0A1H5RFU7_9PSEU|nr:hypothetical protein SAMN05421837_110326 [Amycolatopsis pretoriensis]